MQRERQHSLPEFGDRAGGVFQRSQVLQQKLGVFQRGAVRRLQPAKRIDIVHAAGFQRQHDFREVQPFDFRQFLRGPLVVFALRPQSHANARRSAAGAPGTLVRRRAADLLHEQRIDAAIRIVARDAGQSAVDHDAHAVNRQRRFRDVGRDDELAAVVLGHGGVLVVGRQLAMQR